MGRLMKDSGIPYIGSIPKNWKLLPMGLFFYENKKANRDFLSANALQFKYGEIIQKPKKESLTLGDIELLKKYTLVKPNDIVINGLNLNYDFNSMRVARVREEGIITSAYIVIRARDSHNTQFHNYLLKALDNQKVFHGMGEGIRLTLKFPEIKEMLLPYPLPAEQQKIADFLDRKCREVDELIALEEKMIEELKAYKQSVITETITKGLNPDVPMKDSGIEWIGQIPEHWTTLRLKNVGSLYGGLTGKSGDDFNVEDGDSYALFIPFTNIWNNTEIDPSQLYKVKIEKGEMQNCVKQGDILFLMSSEDVNGVGKPSLCNIDVKPLYLNSFCRGMHIYNDIINSKYLNYFMMCDAGNTFCRLQSNGFIRINLRQDKLSQCPVLRPPLTEQKEITSLLDKQCVHINSIIGIKQSKIAELQDYKKSIIYEYATGKKEVPTL